MLATINIKIVNSIFGSVLLSRLDVVKLFPKNSKLVFHQKSGNDKNANLFLAKTRRKSDETIWWNEQQNSNLDFYEISQIHVELLQT